MTDDTHLLHLSDLHFGTTENADLWSSQLAEDLRNELNNIIPQLDALILSGDIANYSTLDEYKAAEHFLKKLHQQFPLTPEQIIIVPGNHDINWEQAKNAYRLKRREEYNGELREGCYIDRGDIIEIRDEQDYKQRFANFSNFYQAIKGQPYPPDYEQQGILYHLPEQNLLILGLNSAWQLDHHYKTRANIHPIALSKALDQISRDRKTYQNCLKIAVWHHPIHSTGEDRITDAAFLDRLAVAGFRLFLHGHVHKAKTSNYRYDMNKDGRHLDQICAGTFGAPTKELVTGTPWQYNLLKLEDNQLTVYTRRREELNGAWKPDARWSQGKGQNPLPQYTIPLERDQPNPPNTTSYEPRRQDLREARQVDGFYGRTEELARLEQWIVHDQCRVVALLGMGGMGKSALAEKLTEKIKDNFEYVIWRNLCKRVSAPPPVEKILTDLIKFLSNGKEKDLPDKIDDNINILIEYLHNHRCLIVLDNFESVLQAGNDTGEYQKQYEGYDFLLRQVCNLSHQSCLLLTSREQPSYIDLADGGQRLVRSELLKGLNNLNDVQKIFNRHLESDSSFSGTEEEWQKIILNYQGNPFALNSVASYIERLCNKNISEFVNDYIDEDRVPFKDIRDLLDRQIEPLSALEKKILYWLAINRETVSQAELKADIILPDSQQQQLQDLLLSLKRKSIIERLEDGFTLQKIVMEYVTERLIEKVIDEIKTGEINVFNSHALLKAETKDYIRKTQDILILQQIDDRLTNFYGNKRIVETRLLEILSMRVINPHLETGYAAGNILNLLCKLKTYSNNSANLSNYDFSGLTIRQAYLQGVDLREVNFANSEFKNTVFTKAFNSILSVAFSPDGKLLAVGDSKGNICLYQVDDGKWRLLHEERRHTDWVTSLAFSLDGKTLASGSADQTIILWDVTSDSDTSDSNLRDLKTLKGHEGWIRSVTFIEYQGKTLLASGSADRTVKLWDVNTGECRQTLKGHDGWVGAIAFKGEILASSSADKTIKLWNVDTGQCLNTLTGHKNWVASVAFSPDGKTLASGSDDCTVKLWDIETYKCCTTLTGHKRWIRSVAFSLDGQQLASGSADKTIKLWDVAKGQCLKTLQGHTHWIWDVAFSSDGKTLASGSADSSVKLWDIGTGRCQKTFQGYINGVRSVAFSPDGKTLASCGDDQKIRLWDVGDVGTVDEQNEPLKTIKTNNHEVWSVAFSHDSKTLASCGDEKAVKLWDVTTGDLVTLEGEKGHKSWVRSVAFSPDDQILASCGADSLVKLWNINLRKWLRTLEGHEDWVWSVAFSPDGQTLASGSADQTIRLWNVGTGECKMILDGHTNEVRSVTFSPDGQTLVSGSADTTIKLWDVCKGQYLRTLKAKHDNRVLSVAISPDGQTIASGSDDRTVRLWDVRTGECLNTLKKGHTNLVVSVVFSPDGLTLASSSYDETIKLWNVNTGTCKKTLRAPRPYKGMNIRNVEGLSDAEKSTLTALGAVES